MFHQPNFDDQPASRLASGAYPELESSFAAETLSVWTRRLEMPVEELAFRTLVAFRSHSHINNVLTHLSGGNWARVEQELRAIFDPAAEAENLSDLARNVLDLMCAERGVTGRILKPFFQSFLRRLLEQELAERAISCVSAVYLGIGRKARVAIEGATDAMPNPANGSSSTPDLERNERVIHVVDIAPSYRHSVIFQLFEHLEPNRSLQLVVDHDPKRLRFALEGLHGERCVWEALEEGPDVWRVRLRLAQSRPGLT